MSIIVNMKDLIRKILREQTESKKDAIKSIPNNTKGFQTEETHDELDEYSRTLKNARQQGVGLRFPKSAIKANPSRFRPYNR